jgi:ABC-2 type transport system permease protein/lipopolysaccharide transport system permease protein
VGAPVCDQQQSSTELTDIGTVIDVAAPSVAEFAPPSSRLTLAISDLLDGLRRSWLWTTLAQQDIKLRYRGSVLGPFWQTLTTVVMIAGMGIIYSKLFHTELKDYLPMLTVGLIFWMFIASIVTEACGTFTAVQGIIQQVKLPFSLHVYRLVYRNLLTLGHNFVIIPIVLFIFPHPIQPWRLLELLPGLALILVNGIWLSILLGMVSARFRDVPPIVASIIQVVFFMTPVMWPVEALGANAWWAQLNPLFAMLDVMRSPLLGMTNARHSWTILIVVTLAGCVGTFAFFVRFRHRLAFWV